MAIRRPSKRIGQRPIRAAKKLKGSSRKSTKLILDYSKLYPFEEADLEESLRYIDHNPKKELFTSEIPPGTEYRRALAKATTSWKIDPKHELARHSSTFNFRKYRREIRESIEAALGRPFRDIRTHKLIVVAGFKGHFTRVLHEAGFQVVHTDLVEKYAQSVPEVPSVHAPASEIPKMRNALAYVSFEGAPAYTRLPGHIAILKAMAETKGVIDVSTGYGYVFNPAEVFPNFSKVYGCISGEVRAYEKSPPGFGIFGTNFLRNGKGSRTKFITDLRVLQEILKLNRKEVPARAIAERLKLREEEVIVSFRRIKVMQAIYGRYS